MSNPLSFCVIGAGSWGTALAMLLTNNNHKTSLWGHDAEHISIMQKTRRNQRFLPDITLPDSLEITKNLESAIHATVPIIVIPSHGFRGLLKKYQSAFLNCKQIAWATKGLEEHTHLLLHQVVAQELGETIETAVISGPNFAKEVAKQIPSATTVASSSTAFAKNLAEHLHSNWFRAYQSNDMIGVQLGGALKNTLAIATGIADGLNFGANTKAALITRGLAEITRLSTQLGAHTETFMGLSGIGDLVLTCTDNQSRNRQLGLLLASGMSVADATAKIGQAVEGINTSREAFALAKNLSIDTPIIEQVHNILFNNVDPHDAVRSLLLREPQTEN